MKMGFSFFVIFFQKGQSPELKTPPEQKMKYGDLTKKESKKLNTKDDQCKSLTFFRKNVIF